MSEHKIEDTHEIQSEPLATPEITEAWLVSNGISTPSITLHRYARSVRRSDGTIEVWFICGKTGAFRLYGLLSPAGAGNDNDNDDETPKARVVKEARKLHARGLRLRAIASDLDARGFYGRDGRAYSVAQIKAMIADSDECADG
jgi:hypothetical protein